MKRNTDGLRKGIYPGQTEHQDDEPPPEPPRPAPYDIEEAFEQALAPIELPRHTDQHEYEEQPIRRAKHAESNDSNQGDDHNSQPASIFGDAAADGDHATATSGGDNQPQEQTQPDGQPWATGTRSEALDTAHEHDPDAPEPTDEQEEAVPQSITGRLQGLRPWQRQFVVHLMNSLGNSSMACRRSNVSWQSVEGAKRKNARFRNACTAAEDWAAGMVKGSLMQSATIGDLEAVYRGPYLVGWKRNKSVKAAELLLQMSGDIQKGGTSVTLRQDLHVEQVQDAEIPRIVGDVVARLFGGNKGRPVLEAQPVDKAQQSTAVD